MVAAQPARDVAQVRVHADRPAVSTRRRVWLYVAIFAVAVVIYYPFSPGGNQSINMRRAAQHIRTLAPQIRADPRFAQIRIGSFTGQGGSIGVFGTVARQSDAEALKDLIEQSAPPVEVAYRFVIVAPATHPAATRLHSVQRRHPHFPQSPQIDGG